MTKLSARTAIATADLTDDCIIHVVKPGSPNVSYKGTLAQLKSKLGVTWVKVTLTASQVRNGATTPIQIVAAPGAGKVIKFIGGFYNMRFGTVGFDACSTMYIMNPTAGVTQGQDGDASFGVAGDVNGVFVIVQGVGNWKANEALVAKMDADSSLGDSEIDIYIQYQVFDL